VKIQIKRRWSKIILKNNPNYKAIYQEYDWCYQKFVVEGMNHQEMSQEAGTTIRTIKKWVVEKHRITGDLRKSLKTLTQRQEDLLIGSMLGDGHITNEKYIPIFIVSHANNEKDYLYWKYGIFKDLCNSLPALVEAKLKPFGDKVYMSQEAHRFNTRSLDALITFRDMSVEELVNRLNEFSLSIWFLDDGHRDSNHWEICVAPYSELEIEHILKVLREVFNLECKQKSDTRYIGLTAVSSRKLDEIILREVPNDLDVIKKKITENDICEAANYFWIYFKNEKIGLNRFSRNNGIPYSFARKLYFQGITDGSILIEKFFNEE
jgi:hypothetical protein